jgi:Rod binding domain-containing protein
MSYLSTNLAAVSGDGVSSSTAHATPQPRLVHAAHEFEAQMMQELMKPLTSANGLNGEESDSASGSAGALGGFASEALARALSEQGGFGIADSIVRQLTPASNSQVTSQ